MSSSPKIYYTPAQVGVASFLGSALAGGWLVSRTYKAAGHHNAASTSLSIGVLVTASLISMALFGPEWFPVRLMGFAITFGWFQFSKSCQGTLVEHLHVEGAAKAPWWKAILAGVISLIVVLTAIFAVVYFTPGEAFVDYVE